MAPIALTFAILDHSSSGRDLGVILAAQTIPLILFALFGGVIGDRFSRRLVLLSVNMGACVTQALVAGVLLTGRYDLGVLVALVFVSGSLMAVLNPALLGIVPELVATSQVQKANALLGSARSIARIFGVTLGGVLAATLGGGWAIAINAGMYLVAALCMARLPLSKAQVERQAGLVSNLVEGWVEFRSRTWVCAVVASFSVTNCIQVGIWFVLGPMIARDSFGEAAWGAILGIRAAGMLVASAVMYRLVVRRLLLVGLVSVSLSALPLVVLGLETGVAWLAVATLIASVGVGVYGIAWETSLQQHVPRHVLSRIGSYDNLGSFATIPVGQLCAAPLAEIYGAPNVAIVGGVLYLLFALAPLASRSVRELRHGG